MTRRMAAAVGVIGVVAAGLAGCGSSTSPSSNGPSTRTIVETAHPTQPSANAFRPAPASTVRPLPPGRKPRKGEHEAKCPYIKSGLDQDSGKGVNLADLEGDRVYRTTRLTDLHPVGCRFYFYSGPFEAVADIRPRTFATAADAHNAMVLTAKAGQSLIVERAFVPGVDGICFRTKYFGPDGRKDWAFVFAKGKVLVGVYTQRKDTSRNALYIARAIARKF
jgi:hypothetical protein